MDRVPLETLQQIFQFACTDGGYTGGSLALTSRFIREAAQSTRFYSIAVGPETERLTTLAALYQSQCSSATAARPRTAHLYLSTSKPSSDDCDANDDEPAPAHFIAIRQLLSLVAADLQSLVITRDPFATPHPLFDRPLPVLRSLTLVRHADPATLVLPDSGICPLFPALTHLHVVGQPLFFADWAAHAPRVTHLRVSAHSHMYVLLEELPLALGVPPSRGTLIRSQNIVSVDARAARTYPSLARVVVEPGRPPVKDACGTSRWTYTQRCVQLHRIAAQACEVGVEMSVPAPRARTDEEWDSAVKAEWLKSFNEGGQVGGNWFDEEEDEDGEGGEDGEDEE